MDFQTLVPWVGIGALVFTGYQLSNVKAKDRTITENSRTGPPFYEAATSMALRNVGTHSLVRELKDNSHNHRGNTHVEAKQFQELVRDESEKARMMQWRKATDRAEGIIVQPNTRKVVYVNKW